MSRKRFTPVAIALTIAGAVSLLRLIGWTPLELLDLRALDYRLTRRGVQPVAPGPGCVCLRTLTVT